MVLFVFGFCRHLKLEKTVHIVVLEGLTSL